MDTSERAKLGRARTPCAARSSASTPARPVRGQRWRAGHGRCRQQRRNDAEMAPSLLRAAPPSQESEPGESVAAGLTMVSPVPDTGLRKGRERGSGSGLRRGRAGGDTAVLRQKPVRPGFLQPFGPSAFSSCSFNASFEPGLEGCAVQPLPYHHNPRAGVLGKLLREAGQAGRFGVALALPVTNQVAPASPHPDTPRPTPRCRTAPAQPASAAGCLCWQEQHRAKGAVRLSGTHAAACVLACKMWAWLLPATLRNPFMRKTSMP